jgi:hypothetical protein
VLSSFQVRDDSTLEPPYLGTGRTRHDCCVTLSTSILLPAFRGDIATGEDTGGSAVAPDRGSQFAGDSWTDDAGLGDRAARLGRRVAAAVLPCEPVEVPLEAAGVQRRSSRASLPLWLA